jgi:hypothetical protein
LGSAIGRELPNFESSHPVCRCNCPKCRTADGKQASPRCRTGGGRSRIPSSNTEYLVAPTGWKHRSDGSGAYRGSRKAFNFVERSDTTYALLPATTLCFRQRVEAKGLEPSNLLTARWPIVVVACAAASCAVALSLVWRVV